MQRGSIRVCLVFRCRIFAMQTELNGFGEVDGSPPGGLEDLLPAAEPVGDNQRIGGRAANGRQEHSLAHGLGHRKLFAVETKRSRHPAAPGINGLEICAHLAKQ